jgi:hypothetical protein
MKPKLTVGILVAMAFAMHGVAAAQGPDFSGKWSLDKTRSIGLPPNTDQTMIVIQAGGKIDLETRLITSQGERLIKDQYVLDGKEMEFQPQGPSGPVGKGKRTTKWLPRGNGLVATEETTVTSDKGVVTSQLTRKWTLSPDGRTLTVDMYHDTPNGSYETKRIFLKN